jgi:acyl-CoA thioester hydrolase
MPTPLQFRSTHRAAFHQLDPYGHLNTLFYLEFFLTHRFIGMREVMALGMSEVEALPFAFFNRKVDLEFLLPVTSDQPFEIRSWIGSHDDHTCRVVCEMLDEAGKLLARCGMYTVCVDKATGRLTRWPEGFMARFFVPAV